MGTVRTHRPAGERYASATATAVQRLPFGLSRVVAPMFLGFALINSLTFALDLVLLTLLHGQFGVPLPVAVTVAYGSALALAFVLNWVLNFRSHAPLGPQVGRYLGVVTTNYLVCVLGAVAAFTAAGLDYRVARVLAGLCEAAFMYVAMRRVVFGALGRRKTGSRRSRAPSSPRR